MTQTTTHINAISAAAGGHIDLLTFGLGGIETFAMNVHKIQEIMPCPPITRIPYDPPGIVGLISLRGDALPIIDLGRFLGVPTRFESERKLIVNEYSGSTYAFLVARIDKIVRIPWGEIKQPPALLDNGKITSLTKLDNDQLVSIIDSEQILHEAFGDEVFYDTDGLAAGEKHSLCGKVFYVDDSAFARKKIVAVLDRLGLAHSHAADGAAAWRIFESLVAAGNGSKLSTSFNLILTDAEMPEMDGYELTRRIKAHPAMKDIPVLMHSSLSLAADRTLGAQAGVDEYVVKFDPAALGDAIARTLAPPKA